MASEVEVLSEGSDKEFELFERSGHFRQQTLAGISEASIIDDLVDEDDCLLNVTRALDIDTRISINQEFGRGLLYNPQPDQIRKPEDSAKTPGIRSDGSGLYATLLAIKRRRKTRDRNRMVRRDVPFSRNVPFQRVVDYFKFAFPALHSVDVVNDPFDNQIRARVTLDEKDGIQLPLAALSDGTLKWMSLATALLTTRHVIGIEEPENFLHPAVQQQALELIRDHTRENSFVLVSTHSQSILDAAQPEELIFITLDASKTVAKRVKNPEHIKKLIYENGFALSFYYMSGALQNA
jgi:predicted ATPase